MLGPVRHDPASFSHACIFIALLSPMPVCVPHRTVLAVLLVCVELCLLGDEKCAESALRLMSMMKQYLSHLTDGMPGNQAVMSFDSNWHAGLARWRLPARLPLAAQTLEGLVSLVVPLMLPTCHLLPLPSEHPGFVGLVSALLPQQLLNISVQGEVAQPQPYDNIVGNAWR